MASVKGMGGVTEEPSLRKAGHSALSLERASISADKDVVRGLGHGVHDSLAIGSLEWF